MGGVPDGDAVAVVDVCDDPAAAEAMGVPGVNTSIATTDRREQITNWVDLRG